MYVEDYAVEFVEGTLLPGLHFLIYMQLGHSCQWTLVRGFEGLVL